MRKIKKKNWRYMIFRRIRERKVPEGGGHREILAVSAAEFRNGWVGLWGRMSN